MATPKIKALEAKRKALFSIVQNSLELSNKLHEAELKEAFQIKVQTLDRIMREHSQIMDEIIQEKLIINPDYAPSYKHLETIEQMFAQIKFKEAQINQKIKPEPTDTPKQIGRLPSLQLINFAGDPKNWTLFHQNFKELIYDNFQLSDSEKSQYLLSKLSGRALNVIAGIIPSGNNFELLWQTLCTRYQDNRYLASYYLDKILNFKKINLPDEKNLNLFSEIIEASYSALKLLQIPDLADFIVNHLALSKLDKDTMREYEQLIKSEKLPTFESLADHVRSQARIAGRSIITNTKTPIHCNFINRKLCTFCNDSHSVYRCEKFKSLSVPDRLAFVSKVRLCKNCLHKHEQTKCFSKKRCLRCKGFHNTLICEKLNSPTNAMYAGVSNDNCQLIPKLKIHVRSATDIVRAILDTGANGNFISSAFCSNNNIPIRPARGAVNGLGKNRTQILGEVKLTLISRFDSNIALKIEASVLDKITTKLPSVSLSASLFREFDGLPLADDQFYLSSEIDLILGSKAFAQILKNKKVYAKNSDLVAIETDLGFTVLGGLNTNVECMFTSHNCSEEGDSTLKSLQNLWALEEVPTRKHFSPEELACEEHFQSHVKRDDTGAFTVALPFKTNPSELGDSFSAAKRRFGALEKRLEANHSLREGYNNTIQEYIDKGFLSKVEIDSADYPAYYIPHSAVYKPEKSTSKIRIVLDASSKTSSGKSLNDILHNGPNLQSNIFDLLINFRLFRTAICADIEKMFFSIKIVPEHRRFLRILYRFQKDSPVAIYEFERVPFGLSCSPYLARRVINQLFCDEDSPWLKGTLASSTFSYMDDYLVSVQSPHEATVLRTHLVETLAGAGFNLTKWVSNSPEFMEEIPIASRAQTDLNKDNQSELKLLGLWWDPKLDNLFFKTNGIDIDAKYSKRNMLSVTAAVYDPLGFLAPLTAGMKLIIQECWKRDLGWDTIVPVDVAEAWHNIIIELKNISIPKIPRHLGVTLSSTLTLLGFADASEKCYGAVIYARSGMLDSKANALTLVCARSRLAPLKRVSLARLELCAAHLLASLMKTVSNEIKERKEIEQVIACSDSEVTLAWIRSSPHRWHTFIANRTAAIQEIIPPESWYHIAGKINPSDVISRPVAPNTLIAKREWFEGPSWAYLAQAQWPCTPSKIMSTPEPIPELKVTGMVHNRISEPHPLDALIDRTSKWNRLLNVIVYVLRFARRLSSRGPITVEDQETAETLLLKHVQSTHFSEEISTLLQGKACKKSIRKLNPFLENNTVRVGGRLANAPLPYEQRHPILMPSASKISHLIVEHYHKMNCHAGPNLLLALLRNRYWIISARNLVRKIVRSCVVCFKSRPSAQIPLMGNLPECRMRGLKAFDRVGIDYAGPLYITLGRGRHIKKRKAYICLFICLATKAVHLELVSDLTTELFLAAFKRFISRRGPVSLVLSDGGTNFVGANRKLDEIYALLESDEFNTELLQELTPRKIEFKRSPPAAPNFGGIWESNIKNVKAHLFRVVGTQILTYEELYTLLTQIEALLNSRPLCTLSSDPSDPIALTPAHFLHTEPLNYLPARRLDDVEISKVQRHVLVDKLLQSYWKRWSTEYLTALQSRAKWNTNTTPLMQGQIVILKENNLPPLCWPLGVIVETLPGKDGLVRVVKIKTKGGLYIRPASKVCPLPTS